MTRRTWFASIFAALLGRQAEPGVSMRFVRGRDTCRGWIAYKGQPIDPVAWDRAQSAAAVEFQRQRNVWLSAQAELLVTAQSAAEVRRLQPHA